MSFSRRATTPQIAYLNLVFGCDSKLEDVSERTALSQIAFAAEGAKFLKYNRKLVPANSYGMDAFIHQSFSAYPQFLKSLCRQIHVHTCHLRT